jgi:hypothetical protein
LIGRRPEALLLFQVGWHSIRRIFQICLFHP